MFFHMTKYKQICKKKKMYLTRLKKACSPFHTFFLYLMFSKSQQKCFSCIYITSLRHFITSQGNHTSFIRWLSLSHRLGVLYHKLGQPA